MGEVLTDKLRKELCIGSGLELGTTAELASRIMRWLQDSYMHRNAFQEWLHTMLRES